MRRLKVEGAVGHYHCMSRIVAGERLLSGEQEKAVLRKLIWEVAEFCGLRVLTYVVMDNHFHVLVEVPRRRSVGTAEMVRRYRCLYEVHRSEAMPSPEQLKAILDAGGTLGADWMRRLSARMFDVSEYMKTVKQRFAISYNRMNGRFGTLWAERFTSVLVEGGTHALTTVAAYIDLNPVRAGMVEDPVDYRWSGFGEAMSGLERARKGYQSALRGVFPASMGWKQVCARYRILLYGSGGTPRQGAARIDPERVARVLAMDGRVSAAELLRCRVRSFTRGAVLGSKEFVSRWLSIALPERRRKRQIGVVPEFAGVCERPPRLAAALRFDANPL